MKNLILILLLSLVSCQSIYKTTVTYTTDSLGNTIKIVKKEYVEYNNNSTIEYAPYGSADPYYRPKYIPYYRPQYIPYYGPHYRPQSNPKNERYYKKSVPQYRPQTHSAPIRTFPKTDHRL